MEKLIYGTISNTCNLQTHMTKEGRFIFSFKTIDSNEILFEFEVKKIHENYPKPGMVFFNYSWNTRESFEANLNFLRDSLNMTDDGDRWTMLSDRSFQLYKEFPGKNIKLDIIPVNRVLQLWKVQRRYLTSFFEYRLIEIVFDNAGKFKSTNLDIKDAYLLVEKIEEFTNEQDASAQYKIKSLNSEAEEIYQKYLKDEKKRKKEEERQKISDRVKNGENLFSVFIVWYDRDFFHDVIVKKYNQEGLLTWSDALSEDAYDYEHVFGPDILENCHIKQSEEYSRWKQHNSKESDRQKSFNRYENEGGYYSWLKGD